MQKRKTGKRRKFIAGLLVVVAAVVIAGVTIVRAVFQGDEDTVHIKASQIENSTLLIGTHLIHISALTDELYEMALDTAEQSGQTDMYYKSELADGRWYMISGAENLSDITETEKQVDDSVIEALFVRYHTKSDGITYDLKNGTSICMYDTVAPYDLANLPELDALKTQMENLDQKNKKSSTDEKNLKSIQEMMEKGESLKAENAQKDQQLKNVNAVYEKNAQKKELADALQMTMKQTDLQRREAVYKRLSEEWLPALQDEVGNVDEDGYADSDVTDAIGTCIEKVEEKLAQIQGDKIAEDSGSLAAAKKDLMEQIAQAAESGAEDGLEVLAENMTDLEHIESGISVNPDREAELIRNTLLPLSDSRIAESTDASQMESAFAEGEFLAKSAISKMDETAADAFLQERSAALEELTDRLSDADLKKKAENLKEQSINAMKESLTALTQTGENEMSVLLSQKEKLRTDYLSALDENDLNTAKSVEKELESLEQKITQLEEKMTGILNSDSSTQAEKAKAQAALDSGFAASGIDNVKQNVLDDMAEKEYAKAEDELANMSVYAQMSPGLVLTALKEIYQNAASQLYLEESNSADGSDLQEILTRAETAVNSQLNKLLPDENAAGYKQQMEKLNTAAQNIKENIEEGIYAGMDSAVQTLKDADDPAAVLLLTEIKNTILDKMAELTQENQESQDKLTGLQDTIDAMLSEASGKNGLEQGSLSGFAGQITEAKKQIEETGLSQNFMDPVNNMIQLTENVPQGMAVMALLETQNLLDEYTVADSGSQTGQALNSMMKAVEKLTAEAAVLTGEQPDADKLQTALVQAMGSEEEDWTEEEQALAVMAMESCGLTNHEALALAAELAEKYYNNDNPYFYQKLKNEASEFIPLDTFAKCTSWRYIFHSGNKTGILRKGTEFYEYSSFSRIVKEKDGKTTEMKDYARYQSMLYLSEDDMKETFGAEALYIQDSEYAILVTEQMNEKSAEILNALLEYTADN